MAVVAVCGLLVIAAVLAVVRWSGLTVRPPEAPEGLAARPVSDVLRRYLWWLTLATVSGFGAGLLAAGAGGRLVMRLLAVTSPDAQGRITEAGETVGRVTAGGTIAFFVFGGLLPGFVSAVAYLLIHRWLPPGRLGALTFGGLLLVLVGTRVEPLRPGNIDFDIVGPGWLAVVAFGSLVVLHGMLVAALAGRLSRSLPLPAFEPRVLAAYSVLLLDVVLYPIAVSAAVVGVFVVLLSRIPGVVTAWRSHALAVGGRVLVLVVALVSLPGFVIAVADILAA